MKKRWFKWALSAAIVLGFATAAYAYDAHIIGSHVWTSDPTVVVKDSGWAGPTSTWDDVVKAARCPFNEHQDATGIKLKTTTPKSMPSNPTLQDVDLNEIWVVPVHWGSSGTLGTAEHDEIGAINYGLIKINVDVLPFLQENGTGNCVGNTPIPNNYIDIQSVVTHELGHVMYEAGDICNESWNSNTCFNVMEMDVLDPGANCNSQTNQNGYTMCGLLGAGNGTDTPGRRSLHNHEEVDYLGKY